MREQEGEELFDDLSCQSAPENKNAVAARLRTAERRQIALRAVCLDELVPNDHRVRMVWSFVEGLDLSALLAGIKSVDGRPGHPPCDPRILMALWLTQRSRAWRAHGALRGCARIISPISGCAAELA